MRTKIIEVTNIINVYAAVGTINTISSNNCVATQLFDDIVFMVPTAAYTLIMFVTSIIFVLIVRKIN